jgi:hypothetical protein
MKKYYIITIRANYADEFDVTAFKVFSEEELKNWKKSYIDEYGTDYHDAYFGTNEEVEISFNDYKIKEISENDYKTLKNLDLLKFGHTNLI